MIRRWLSRRRLDPRPPAPIRDESVIGILDQGCADFVFPMLDNGYLYLAAARMSLYRSSADWALVFEIFGFSPRSGIPAVGIWAFGSRLGSGTTPSDGVSGDSYDNQRVHPHDDAAFFFPIEPGPWQDDATGELVALDAESVKLRGRAVRVPDAEGMARYDIAPTELGRIQTFELCRYLAATSRDDVLATEHERRTFVGAELAELLVLDDWHHPNLIDDERASDTAAFRSLARVLESGDASLYDASEPPNTDWHNWPLGGSL